MKIGTAIYTFGTGASVEKTHLVADEGKQLTRNGTDYFSCVDVDSIDGWYETDAPSETEEHEY